ncbi:type II toxin-antitoxin system RelE family toxin [Streptomyces kutzneri]|uniref:type II toxin-antitoxin system RelE family toxin n=1 Tax=Streptomyces kutzneri TaxID=3051179 RepID=UPI003F9C26CF
MPRPPRLGPPPPNAPTRAPLRHYRVVYALDNGELVVWVVHVGHRSTVYDT